MIRGGDVSDDLQLKTTLTADAGPLNGVLRASGQAVQVFTAEVEGSAKRQAAAEQGATTAVAAHAAAMKQAAADAAPAIRATDGMTTAAQAQAQSLRVATADLAAAEAIRKARATAEQESMRGSAISAGQLSMAYRQLPAQITDITTSLASGMPIWMVAVQQGGQIKDSFGGIRPAMSALLGMVSPTALAFGALAAAGGGLAYAMYSGRQESKELEQALRTTGGMAGLTHGQIDALTVATARNGDITVGTAREITASLVATGELSGPALASVAAATATLARVTGKAAGDIVTSFSGLADAPAQSALKLNTTYHFLTPAVYEQVAALQAQNKQQQAAQVVADALNATMKDRTVPQLGALEKAAKAAGEAFSGMWAAAKGLGAPETVEQQLAAVETKLKQAATRKADGGTFAAGDRRAWDSNRDSPTEALELQAQILRRRIGADGELAAFRAKQQEDEAARLKELSAGHQSALIALEAAGAQQRLAVQTAGIEEQRGALKQQFDQNLKLAQDYQAELFQIDLAANSAKIANIDRLRAAEAGRKGITDPDQLLAQQAALKQFDAQRAAAIAERITLARAEVSGDRDIAPKLGATLPSDGLRAMRGADEAASDAAVKARKEASAAAEAELLAGAKASSQALIQDARARATALIATDEARLRKQLDIEGLSVDERREMEIDLTTATAAELARRDELEGKSASNRKRIEDELAAWRIGREKEVTQQFAPEWERLLAGWRDTNQLMKTSFDSTMLATVNAGEQAWIQFAQTGKLSVKSLVDTIAAESARQAYRAFMGQVAPFVSAGLGALFGSDAGITTGGTSLTELGLGGGRASGGPVSANSLQPVNERGPEVLTLDGQDYLMMGSRGGQVTRNEDALQPLPMPRGGNSGSAAASAAPAVTAVLNLSVLNQTGTPVKASATQRPDGGVELLLQAAEENMAGNVMQGAGPMSRALEQRYGLRST